MMYKHPIIYQCDDFTFCLERWNEIPFLHLDLHRFSHNVFKKMKAKAVEISKDVDGLFAYGPDLDTERLLRMAGFKNTQLMIINENRNVRRALCLPV